MLVKGGPGYIWRSQMAHHYHCDIPYHCYISWVIKITIILCLSMDNNISLERTGSLVICKMSWSYLLIVRQKVRICNLWRKQGVRYVAFVYFKAWHTQSFKQTLQPFSIHQRQVGNCCFHNRNSDCVFKVLIPYLLESWFLGSRALACHWSRIWLISGNICCLVFISCAVTLMYNSYVSNMVPGSLLICWGKPDLFQWEQALIRCPAWESIRHSTTGRPYWPRVIS